MSDLSTSIEPWTLADIVAATGGTLVHASPAASILGVSTDSRVLPAHGLFVALKGEKFDGHDFVAAAVANGAAAVMVERPLADQSLPQVVTPDALQALGDLARAYRQRFDMPLAALTGTSGKTTTKELLASICRQAHRTLATTGNLNNLIGVPLTLFRLTGATERAVIELGMSHPGENRRLADIALPTVGIVTSVGPSHLEGVGDEDGVLNAEAELIDFLNTHHDASVGLDASVVLDADAPPFARLAERVRVNLMAVGESPRATRRLTDIQAAGAAPARFCYDGTPIRLCYAGRHNVANAGMAAAAAELMGCSREEITAGLEAVQPKPGRSRILLRGGVTLIDDCYNANPLSFHAALSTLKNSTARRRLVVFADMLELGPDTERYHRELGADIATTGAAIVFWKGDLAAHAASAISDAAGSRIELVHAADNSSLSAGLKERLQPGDVVLIKASHGMRLDQVVDALLAYLPTS